MSAETVELVETLKDLKPHVERALAERGLFPTILALLVLARRLADRDLVDEGLDTVDEFMRRTRG